VVREHPHADLAIFFVDQDAIAIDDVDVRVL
jgi:hypothetical protein